MSPEPPSPADDHEPSEPKPLDYLRKQVRSLQNGIATRLGISAADRASLIASMLSKQEDDALSYWLQIFLSMGIATLGLVLDSTGVVIGAMLISPLMTPIVALGMGLTTGSPFLTLRSAARVLASVAFVIASAALITRLLPFHEVTGEIAGRTAPTLIDLGIASFCALAAGFTTVRNSSDTVAAAAGTAIGIALVPPLCVSGFGIGIASPKVAFGATLLFTANFCSILLFTVLLFFCIGYNQADIPILESKNVKVGGRVAKIAAALRRAFTTRYGPLLRFLLPLLLVAAVFIPLSRALREVAWKVRVQAEVAQILDEVTADAYTMRSATTVEHGQVAIRLVVVASPERAAELEDELRTRCAAVAGAVPTVEVHAVPDFASLQQVADSIQTPVIAPTEDTPDLAMVRERVDERLARWPRGADAILYWSLSFGEGACVIEVAHVGTEGGDFLDLLAETIGERLDCPVRLRERAVELGHWEAEPDGVVAWLPKLQRALEAAMVPGISACVTRGPLVDAKMVEVAPEPVPEPEPAPQPAPEPEPGQPEPEPEPEPKPVYERIEIPIVGASAAAALVSDPAGAVLVSESDRWSVDVIRGDCP